MLIILRSSLKEVFKLENSLWGQFTNQYQVSKTLRFELNPIGKTKEMFDNGKNPLKKIIDDDKKRALDYKKAKKIIDAYHREFIEKALDGLEFQTEDLKKYQELQKDITKTKSALSEARKKKEGNKKTIETDLKKIQKNLSDLQDKLRNQVFECFQKLSKTDDYWKGKTNKGGKQFFFDKSLKTTQHLIKLGIPRWLEDLDETKQENLQEQLEKN